MNNFVIRAQDMLNTKLDSSKWSPVMQAFSAYTDVLSLQSNVMSKLDKRRKGESSLRAA
jgi:hypothetical protein